jgi:hypothetical protein
MNEDIIEMARQAGFEDFDRWCEHYPQETQRWCQRMEAFAKLVAAKEREACAKVCESLSLEWEEQPDIAQVELATMLDCALAIRARGEAC